MSAGVAVQQANAEMCAKIVAAIRSAIGTPKKVSLHEPMFAGNEWQYVKDCIDSGWVSSVGAYVDRLEAMLAEFTGARRAVAVVNGTAALHACLKLVGVQAGDEVLIPTLTFVATANAVAYCGATPHFVDSSEETLGMDAEKLGAYLGKIAKVRQGACVNRVTGAKIAAVVPMHTFGHPVNLDTLEAVCQEWHIPMVEDAAESLGSYYKGQHTGTRGLVAALSFNGNKVVTTGGGGAILTNDEALGKLAKHITTTARVPHAWSFMHDMVGHNYRMPNINAALGCAQMEQLPGMLEAKRRLAERYRNAFADVAGANFVDEPENCTSNFWLNCVRLEGADFELRDAVLKATNEAGLMTRPAWTLMHKLPMFSDAPRMDLSVAELLERELINVPSSAVLGSERG